jgi:hypothetical protein
MSDKSQKDDRSEDHQEPPIPDPSELLKEPYGDLSYEVRKGSEKKDNG